MNSRKVKRCITLIICGLSVGFAEAQYTSFRPMVRELSYDELVRPLADYQKANERYRQQEKEAYYEVGDALDKFIYYFDNGKYMQAEFYANRIASVNSQYGNKFVDRELLKEIFGLLNSVKSTAGDSDVIRSSGQVYKQVSIDCPFRLEIAGKVVDNIPKGTKVKILALKGNWSQVQYGDAVGWVINYVLK